MDARLQYKLLMFGEVSFNISSKHIWAKVSHVIMDYICPHVISISFQKIFLTN